MKQWWQNLNQREQQLVSVAAVVVALAVLYWGIVTPLTNAKQQASDKLQQQQQTLEWVMQAGDRLASQQRTTSNSKVKLSQAVSSSARQQRITLSKIQPRGEELEVWIEQVPFNQFIGWVHTLHERYGINVDILDIESLKPQGMIKVKRLKLSKSE